MKVPQVFQLNILLTHLSFILLVYSQIQNTGKAKILHLPVSPHLYLTPSHDVITHVPRVTYPPPPAPHYRGLLGTLRVIAYEEGTRGLYSGIGAGLQRQMCFASIRIGFYDDVKFSFQRLFGTGKLIYI